jgi:KUP system potassium uptake protein
VDLQELGHGFHQVVLRYGFMEQPDVPQALAAHRLPNVPLDLASVSYFVGRESIKVTARPGMARWREHLYSFLSRNSGSAANYFNLPIDQTVEVGVGVEL